MLPLRIRQKHRARRVSPMSRHEQFSSPLIRAPEHTETEFAPIVKSARTLLFQDCDLR